MGIVSSYIVEDRAQIDGRRDVRERHVDHMKVAHEFSYVAAKKDDVAAIMRARVPVIEAELAANEIECNLSCAEELGADMVSLNYSTIEQNIAAVRGRFEVSSGMAAGRLAKWLLARTDLQLRAAFGMDKSQASSLRTRLQSKDAAGDAASNLAGE